MTNANRADLVLSGGGVKGVGLVGAVVALLDAGYAPQRVSGTSAGSIVGAVVAAAAQYGQVSGEQVKDLALQLDYSKFLDPGPIERVPSSDRHWRCCAAVESTAATTLAIGFAVILPTSASPRSATSPSTTPRYRPNSGIDWWSPSRT